MTKQVKSSFTITIAGQAPDYTIEANGLDNIQVESYPFDFGLINQHEDTLSMLASKPRRVSVEELEALGQALYQTLFVHEIAMSFGRVQQNLKGVEEGIRLRIQTNISEIARLPWELMHDGREFIALRSNFPIVRGTDDSVASLRTDVGGALRILYAWSNPNDLPQLRLQEPAEKIQDMLSEEKRIQFDILENATRDTLGSKLLEDYHILCFAGHGTTEYIYLEEGKSHERISAQALAVELEGKPTRLVFLAACDTGGYTRDNLPGFAQALARQADVPAVVAMQYLVNDQEANLLTTRYFEALAKFRPVDVALAEARKAIVEEERVIRDVFSPVLYLQTESSRLFQASRNRIAIGLGIALSIAIILILGALYLARESNIEVNEQAAQQAILKVTGTAQAASNISADATALAEATKRAAVELDLETLRKSDPQATAQAASLDALYHEMALASIEKIDDEPELALLMAMEAAGATNETGRNPYASETGMALFSALRSPYRATYRGDSFILDPKGEHIVTTEGDSVISLWDARNGELITSIKGSEAGFCSDGGRIVTYGGDRTAEIWNVADGSHVSTLEGHDRAIELAALSPDCERVITSSSDRTEKLWQTEDGLLLANLRGHREPILAIDFNNDGSLVLTAGNDDTARLWDTLDGSLLAELADHNTNDIEIALFSPDDTRIVTAGRKDSKANLWNGKNGAFIATLEAEDASVGTAIFNNNGSRVYLADDDSRIGWLWNASTGDFIARLADSGAGQFSSDNDRLVTAGSDKLHLWNSSDGSLIASLIGHSRPNVTSVKFNPDGAVVASAADDNTVRLWNGINGAPIASLAEHTGGVTNVAFNSLGNRLLSVSTDGATAIWDVDAGSLLFEIQGNEAAVFSPDGMHIFSLGDNDTVLMWDAQGAQEVIARTGFSDRITSIDVSPDGTRLAVASWDGTAKLWDRKTNLLIDTLKGHNGGIWSIGFSNNGDKLLTIGDDGLALLWDGWNGEQLAKIIVDEKGYSYAAGNFSGDDTAVLTGGSDGYLRSWSLDSLNPIWETRAHDQRISAFDSSRNGGQIVTGSVDGSVKIWDAEDGSLLHKLQDQSSAVLLVKFSPDDGRVVLVGENGGLRIWNNADGTTNRVLNEHTAPISAFGFSSQDARFATGNEDGIVQLWDLDGNLVAEMTGHAGTVRSLRYSPDGVYILTASDDGTARLWDGHSGDLLQTFSGHSGAVMDAIFNADDFQIITGGADKTVREWPYYVSIEQMLDIAAKRISRTFTNEECQRYFETEQCPETLLINNPQAPETGVGQETP